MAKNNKAISAMCLALEKKFGEKTVQKMGTDMQADINTISSGRADLDQALGGGYGVGKIIEIIAEEACGKTGLALEVTAEVQGQGGTVGFIDMEHALNKDYCNTIGVDIEELYLSQPRTGEDAFTIMRAMIQTEQFDLIIVDSVTGLVPRAILECETGESKM